MKPTNPSESSPLEKGVEKTDNELIAEFMGIDFTAKDAYLTYPPPICKRFGQYDRSWDWLMPVVEKIRTLLQDNTLYENSKDLWNFICAALSTVEIKAVNIAVIQWIEWYNSQQHAK